MGQHELRHLLKMLEQIAANFAWETDPDRAAAAVAAHIKRFWSSDMRAQVLASASADASALSPLARSALSKLD